DSFAVEAKPNAGSITLGLNGELQPDTDHVAISIARESLEKEFLLQISMIPQETAATGSALKSRVVAFRQRGSNLYLLEATQGHSVNSELPQNLLLAEYPILKQTNTHITFDFNKGMSQLFTMSEWHGQDGEKPTYDGEAQF